MGILGHRKQRKEFHKAAQTLRKHGIGVTGPYRRPNGRLVFSVASYVVTEEELLHLSRDRRLETNKVQELLAEIGKGRT